MLLRSITQHVRDQNWTAIAIDFVIVVVGVFIGIQVSNWNDERLREETAEDYVERLRADLRSNREDLSQRLAYFSAVRNHGVDALAALDRPPETWDRAFIADVYQASHMLKRELGRDTYNEILSVGANNAISDPAMRQRLSNFYRSIRAQIELLEFVPPYRDILRTHFPYGVSRELSSSCGFVVTTRETGEPVIRLADVCEPDLTDEQIETTINILIELDIRNALARRLNNLDAKLWAIQLMIDRVDQLDEFLASKSAAD